MKDDTHNEVINDLTEHIVELELALEAFIEYAVSYSDMDQLVSNAKKALGRNP